MERGSGRGTYGGRKWAVELCDSSPSSYVRDVPDPLGYSRASLELEESAPGKAKKEIDASFKQAKAWETAQAPFKNLFMIGFMMWMAGNTVHLFSIGITFSALWQPISALQAVNKTFEPFKDARTDTLLPKLVFIAFNFVGLAMEELEATRSAKNQENQAICQRMIEHSLARNPTVKFMREALAKAGCPVTEKFFKSENCALEAGGGFVPRVGISVCSNHLLTVTQGEVDMILTHELIHAYDHCRASNLDWSNCQHHACSEIRAANLSGDCKWMLELLRGHTNIRQQHQVCVRRRAQLSVAMNPHCSEMAAKKAVDATWNICYKDTKPFDRVP